MMKIRSCWKMALMSISAVGCAVIAASSAKAGVVDKVIVVVNDEVVTQREFDRAFTPLEEKFKESFKGEELTKRTEEAKKFLLEQMVNSKLAISIAKKKDLKIDEKEFKDKIDEIKGFYKSEDEFLKELSDKGTTLTEFEQEVREHMLAQKLVETEISTKIIIAPAEIQDVYSKNEEKFVSPAGIKLRSIMVRKKEGSDGAEEKKKIDGILAEIKGGKSFADIAKASSEDPYAENGGEMGFVAKGQMIPEIEDATISLKKGEMTGVVETKIGFHLFLVDDVKEPTKLGLAEVNDFIKEQIFKKKLQEGMVKWIEEQKKKAYIAYK